MATAKRVTPGIVFAFMLFGSIAPSQPASAQPSINSPLGLKEISDTAVSICGIVQASGGGITTETEGKVRGEVEGLATKLLGGASGGASRKIIEDVYTNIRRDDLPNMIVYLAGCRERIFNSLRPLLDVRGGQSPGSVQRVVSAISPASVPQSAEESCRGWRGIQLGRIITFPEEIAAAMRRGDPKLVLEFSYSQQAPPGSTCSPAEYILDLYSPPSSSIYFIDWADSSCPTTERNVRGSVVFGNVHIARQEKYLAAVRLWVRNGHGDSSQGITWTCRFALRR